MKNVILRVLFCVAFSFVMFSMASATTSNDNAPNVYSSDKAASTDKSIQSQGQSDTDQIILLARCNRDGSGCWDDSECCSNACKGGSCCTESGNSCGANSHCCTRQACTDGVCP
jgi:hypothetical protein